MSLEYNNSIGSSKVLTSHPVANFHKFINSKKVAESPIDFIVQISLFSNDYTPAKLFMILNSNNL